MKSILFFVLSLLSVGFTNAAENKYYDTMVVLGDSLSDNGNLYEYLWHTLPATPPYYNGHFSNGPIWVEQLYGSYFHDENPDGMQNYAVGGAGAVLAYKQHLPYTLTMELDNYLYWHTYGKKDTTLFTIWIGSNNYLNGPTNVESITDSVVKAIGKSVDRLVRAGGTKFLITNLPDLTKTPFVNEYGTQRLINQLVLAHNQKLADKVEALRDKYPHITLVYFDIYSFFNKALEHASDYGFTNTYEPCYLGGYIEWLVKNPANDDKLQHYVAKLNPQFDSANWSLINDNPQLKEAVAASYLHQLLPAKNKDEALHCDKYVFWDRIHPTTKAHAIIAEQARKLLDEGGLIPFVPGTAPVTR